jgi:hypothetical protein
LAAIASLAAAASFAAIAPLVAVASLAASLLAVASLVVIPEGDLLLPSLILAVILSAAKDPAPPTPHTERTLTTHASSLAAASPWRRTLTSHL